MPLLGAPVCGRGSRCRHLTPEVRDLAVVRVGGGEPDAVLAGAREGAGEPGGSPAGGLPSVGRVERSWVLSVVLRCRGLAPRPEAGAAPVGGAVCLLLWQ